ncbi:CLOCK-interacting pacemaker a isoform X1 [Pungitius pungitius]|uniref:CLOCK-interacting pacemaker a isoform X1 n=2 Tax=Pungitius pungitius TaxID=134920 RepID=UPI002E113443
MSSFSRPERHRTPSFTKAAHFGASKSDLGRDSGFSDASSEHLSTVDLTDSEDAGRNGFMVGHDPLAPQVAVMRGSCAGLSPMIIMNNFVLKQPSQMSPPEKQWSFPSPLDILPQSQMVLLQTVVSNSSSSCSSTNSENTQPSKSCVPVLKSYPKIAPHPSDVPAKRAGSSKVRFGLSSGRDQRHKRPRHGHRLHSSASLQPAPRTEIKSVPNSEAAAGQSQAAHGQGDDGSVLKLAGSSSALPNTDEFPGNSDGSDQDADQDDAFSMDVNKLKRFSNTYNVLNKSGLLGITMRTKQLIKENKRTQGQLRELREQTVLLLEAQSSGDPHLWTKLQLSLQHTDKE